MDIALLALRVVVGLLFVGHGAQKLFGWFRGHGPAGTAGFFEQVGLRPGLPLAVAAGLAEVTGGALFALGLATPIAVALITAVMLTAIATVHWQHGIWSSDGGFEFPLVMLTAAFAVAAIGPGHWALDRVLEIERTGLVWAGGAVAVGALASLAVLAFSRLRKPSAVERREEPPMAEAA